MPTIPFPQGLTGSTSLPRTQTDLINCWKTPEGRIQQRPGIEEIKDIGSIARGQFVWNDSLYQVVSTSLIKITNVSTGAFTTIGTIAGSAAIQTAIGFVNAVIVVPGGNIYTLDKSDTLINIISNTNFVACDFVTHIDNRFVYVPTSGDPVFFSDVGVAGTVQTTSFFDEEFLPDKNKAAFNLNNTLYIMGSDSIGLYVNRGVSPVPFVRRSGGFIANGFIGGLLEYNQTFLFIGREKGQNSGIYAIGQGSATKISNEAIDDILANHTLQQLAGAIPNRFKYRGYDIATFTLSSNSFGFFQGQWFTLESIVSEENTIWGAGFITQFEGEYYTAFSSKFGKLSAINKDYGEFMTRVIQMGISQADDEWFSAQKISLGISQGLNSSSGSVALMMSRSNVQFSQPISRDTGAIGEYSQKLTWNFPGGLGKYKGFMGIKFLTRSDIDFSCDYLTIDITGGIQ